MIQIIAMLDCCERVKGFCIIGTGSTERSAEEHLHHMHDSLEVHLLVNCYLFLWHCDVPTLASKSGCN